MLVAADGAVEDCHALADRWGARVVDVQYKDARPAEHDAVLDLQIPLVGREVRVRLSDLSREGW